MQKYLANRGFWLVENIVLLILYISKYDNIIARIYAYIYTWMCI